MYLLIDTETTGKWQKNLPVGNIEQPRMVQLAAMLVQPDGHTLATLNIYTRPGIPISVEAQAIHGISNEFIEACGIHQRNALELLTQLADLCQAHNGTLIGHNIEFDRNIVCNAYIQTFSTLLKGTTFAQLAYRCTMKECTPICKLPGRFGDFKWPKLAEAYKIVCGKDMSNKAHDALYDLTCTKELVLTLDAMKSISKTNHDNNPAC